MSAIENRVRMMVRERIRSLLSEATYGQIASREYSYRNTRLPSGQTELEAETDSGSPYGAPTKNILNYGAYADMLAGFGKGKKDTGVAFALRPVMSKDSRDRDPLDGFIKLVKGGKDSPQAAAFKQASSTLKPDSSPAEKILVALAAIVGGKAPDVAVRAGGKTWKTALVTLMPSMRGGIDEQSVDPMDLPAVKSIVTAVGKGLGESSGRRYATDEDIAADFMDAVTFVASFDVNAAVDPNKRLAQAAPQPNQSMDIRGFDPKTYGDDATGRATAAAAQVGREKAAKAASADADKVAAAFKKTSAKQVNRVAGRGGYEYALMSDDSIIITKSPRNNAGYTIRPDSPVHATVMADIARSLADARKKK